MVHLDLEDDQAVVLREVLDWWIDAFPEATSQVISDRTFDTAEDLLEATGTMVRSLKEATDLRDLIAKELVTSS